MNTRKSLNPLAIIAILTLLLPVFAWASTSTSTSTYPSEVARTGQTTCYDTSGAVIACSGTGQDGDYLAGAPLPNLRFINNNDGTVKDSLTGLEWAQDANAGGAMTWQAALDYVKTLNTGGHNDWRLPNVNELESLVNAQLSNPALPQGHPFANVQSSYYWSSTSYASNTHYAWIVDMSYGYVGYYNKSYYGYDVWPVRSGQCGSLGNSVICLPKTGQTSCFDSSGASISCTGTGQDGDIQAGVAWPSQRFVDNGETVTDSLTGLEWTKNANLAGGYKTWQGALDYVKTLNTGGHSDWRLPNERELRSLADYSKYSPALPTGHPFTNVQSGNYWSSTCYAIYTYSAWIVGMGNGRVSYGDKSVNGGYVWPVRSGQVGNLIISSTTTTTGSTTTSISTTTVPVTTTSVISSTTTTAAGGSSTTTTSAGVVTTTTTAYGTTTTTACPATQALGSDNPKLENLRSFRDSKLAQSVLGRKAIEIYYNNAGSINAALERSPALRAATRKVLETIAPMVGRKE